MFQWFRLVLLILLVVTPGLSQVQVHFGVDAGIPITDTLSSYSMSSLSGDDYSLNRFNSVTKRLLIGPSFRLDLAKGLGLEFDALYQRVNYDYTSVSSIPESPYFYKIFEPVTANRWQFPLLVQYSRRIVRIKLFVEAGPAISTIGNGRGTLTTTFTSTFILGGFTTTNTATTKNTVAIGQRTFAGITTGVGVDLPLFHSHLRPEFRYSHWFSPNSANEAGGVLGLLLVQISAPSYQIEQNEAGFLVGLTF